LSEYLPVICPYCGEMAELTFEDEGWSRQSYVQDCPVCCQPWQVELARDADGDWNASVKTGDE
jgi:cysteine-rich CPXCG protein